MGGTLVLSRRLQKKVQTENKAITTETSKSITHGPHHPLMNYFLFLSLHLSISLWWLWFLWIFPNKVGWFLLESQNNFLGLDWKAKTERDRDNGNAMGHDPVDGKDGVGGSDWVGFFLLDCCWWSCQLSQNRWYRPFPCWLIGLSNSTIQISLGLSLGTLLTFCYINISLSVWFFSWLLVLVIISIIRLCGRCELW